VTTLKARTTTIPIYQGDDAERLAEKRMAVALAERRVEQIRADLHNAEQRAESDRYGDDDGATREDLEQAEAAAEQARGDYDAFVDEAADRAVEVIVQTIGRRRFRDLVAAHPQRMVKDPEGKDVPHDDDYDFGVNTETFSLALLAYVDSEDTDIRTIVAPEFKGTKAVQTFLDDELTEGDFTRIWTAAYWLNRMPSADPKALRYSPSTDATSE
jgi:hypothetical protein